MRLSKIKFLVLSLMLVALSAPALAVLPNIFATQPAGNVQASLLDTNFTFIENQGVQALVTTGSANTYIATPSDSWTTGYSSFVGRSLTIKPNFTNTGASTVNVSGLGAASIYKNIGGVQTAIVSGDMVSGTPVILICDGSGFLLVNPTSGTSGVQSVKRQVFLSNGTYTPCSGNLYSELWCIGAGAGGGGVNATVGAVGGGGAAGSESRFLVSAGTIGASKTITVGTGGAAGSTAGGTGGTGGTTSVGSLVTCLGGLGGNGSTSSNNSTPGGAGQAATGGNVNGTGAPGGAGDPEGSTLRSNSGVGGSTSIGGGGLAVSSNGTSTATAGNAGAAHTGSGGSGAFAGSGPTAELGGAGADGQVIITEYCSQ